MKIVTTCSDTISPDLYNKALTFVQGIVAENPKSPAIHNMGLDSSAGFLWNVEHKSRWTEGKGEITFLMSDAGDIVGLSCVETSKQELLSIGGIRTWVLKPYRGKNVISNMLLESNLEWTKNNNMAGMLLTFNDYNRWIYEGIRRKTAGKAAGVASVWSDWWNDCIVIPRPLKVRFVNQWCVLKPTGMHDQELIEEIIRGLDVISE